MHVILLNGGASPKTLSRSIGPYKIAYWLRKHDYTCQVIDHITYFSESQLRKAVNHFISTDTVVIGVSTTFISNSGYQH